MLENKYGGMSMADKAYFRALDEGKDMFMCIVAALCVEAEAEYAESLIGGTHG